MKRINLLAAIISGVLLVGAKAALADSCSGPGFVLNPGVDCTVTGAHAVSGTLTFNETLHMLAGSSFNASASGVTIVVDPGSVVMEKNSRIFANGDNITINVPNGDMTMLGSPLGPGSTDKCGYDPAKNLFLPSNALGAQIWSLPAVLATTITINVGNYPTPNPGNPLGVPLGSFLMERCSVVSVSTGKDSAGTIKITAGHEADLDGLVLSESILSGSGANQKPGGGPITVQTGCVLRVSSEGVVSSKGQDPGADLVHLEGCDVFIDGLVQSTGEGHAIPSNPANHCATGVHSGKPASSTGCVEIIGQNITISNTGEVDADVSSFPSGGPEGTSWIDLFAYDDIKITGPTGVTDRFSVHANSILGSDHTPNTITAVAGRELATPGTFIGTGKILSASNILNGSWGGTIDIQAAGAVTLDTSTIRARGDNVGGLSPCDIGSGACGRGGIIKVQSFNAGISWQNGVGDVNPDKGPSPPAGAIFLTSCTALPAGIVTTGTSFDDAVPTQTGGVACGTLPTIPAYIAAAFLVGDPIWDACQPFFARKSGMKFNDMDNSGSFTAGDTPIAGWPINLLTTGNVLITTVNTAADGSYSFTFNAPGTFRVCEGVGPAGFVQTFPHAGNVHVGETIINTCPAPNIWGYQFTVVNNSTFTGDDFGNNKPSRKSGKKYNDVDNSATITVPPDTPIVGWPIKLYKLPDLTTAVQTVNTGAGGAYSFTIKVAGDYQVCEGVGPAGFTQTFPNINTSHGGETIVSNCPAPNVWGYKFTIDSGDEFADDDFANFKQGGGQECKKQTVIDIMNATYPGNGGPDFTVHTNLGESVQDAVTNAFDKNGDGYIIVMVIAHADGSLGGTANQKVVVSKDYGTAQPFGLFGCSVTLTGGGTDPAIWVKDTALSKEISVNGRATTIFVADLHGGNSAVGLEADGTKRYIRNEQPTANGIGIKILGNGNTVHNGSAQGSTGVGLQVNGDSNLVTDTAVYTSGSHGVQVTGSNNQLLKIKAGDIGKGNGGDGLNVSGSNNVLQENTARSNALDGFRIVAGTGNTLKKNVGGGTASQDNGDCEFDVVAGNTNLGENKANGVTVPGVVPGPFPTGCIGTP